MIIQIKIQKVDGTYYARAIDYKINATGRTKEEAKTNLKNHLITYFNTVQ